MSEYFMKERSKRQVSLSVFSVDRHMPMLYYTNTRFCIGQNVA